jgi:hypothetical protein
MVIHEFAAPKPPLCPSRCPESCSVFVHPLRVPIPSPNRWTKAVHEDARRLPDTCHSIFILIAILIPIIIDSRFAID